MSRTKITSKDITLLDVIKTFFDYRKSIVLSLLLGVLVSVAVYYKTSYNKFFISDMVRLNYFEINTALGADPIRMSEGGASVSISKKFLVDNFLKILSDKKLINRNLNKHYYGKEDIDAQSVQSNASAHGENQQSNVNVDVGEIISHNTNLKISKIKNDLYAEIEMHVNFEYEGNNHDNAKKFLYNLLDSAERKLQNIILSAKEKELERVLYMRDELVDYHFKRKVDKAKIEGKFTDKDLSQLEFDIFKYDILRKDDQLSTLNDKYILLERLVKGLEDNRINIIADFPREFYISEKQKTFLIVIMGLVLTLFYLLIIFVRSFYRFL